MVTKTDDDNVAIRTVNLTRHFGMGSNLFKAVDGINITVPKGQIHGFLGPNGAGKTTTIKMLVGALTPTKGEGYILKNEIGTVASKQLFGYSPERPAFYEKMTAVEYLEYIGQLCGMPLKKAKERAKYLLQWLELDEAKNRKISFFSAGMKQKLGLAQALIHEPELLILDEPTANLDPIGRANIIDKIRQLAKEKNTTVFVSSHILGEIEKMADMVTIIDHGKILLESDVKSLKHHFEGNHFIVDCSNNSLLLKVFKSKDYVSKAWMEEEKINLMVTNEEDLKKDLPDLLIKNKVMLESFGKISLSLESIFMEVIGEEKHAKS